jgi:hypothetical protein
MNTFDEPELSALLLSSTVGTPAGYVTVIAGVPPPDEIATALTCRPVICGKLKVPDHPAVAGTDTA